MLFLKVVIALIYHETAKTAPYCGREKRLILPNNNWSIDEI